MPKTGQQPLQKHTLNLFKGDYERLSDLFPNTGGSGVVIRTMVRKMIEKVEKENRANLNIEVDL